MDETGDFDLEVQEANAEECKSIVFCGKMRDLRVVGVRWTLSFDTGLHLCTGVRVCICIQADSPLFS